MDTSILERLKYMMSEYPDEPVIWRDMIRIIDALLTEAPDESDTSL